MSEKHLNEFADLILDLKDRKTVKNFLSNMLTPVELEEVVKRLQIIKQLQNGIPQRRIAENLNVSIATVSRGSRELKYGNWWQKNINV